MRIFVTALVVLLAACAAGEPSDARSPSPTPRDKEMADEAVTGELGSDAIEGGCAYLQTDDGARYEVIYPGGWEISASPLQLTDPDGDVVATGGETITVRGEEATDMASICQIGPIFRATEVVSID